MDETVETLAEALNEEFGAYPWDRADKPVFRLRAKSVIEAMERIKGSQ